MKRISGDRKKNNLKARRINKIRICARIRIVPGGLYHIGLIVPARLFSCSDYNVNDIHGFNIGFQQAMRRLEAAEISDYNKDLDKLNEADVDNLLLLLEAEEFSSSYIRNYKKALKKLNQWLTDGDSPKFIRELKVTATYEQVEPKDLLTDSEVEKLLGVCKNARDRALIAILLDSGLRVGAVGSLMIENVELNTNSGIIRPNKDSKSNKTFAKAVPITWSCGYIGQWLSVHP